MKTKSELKEPKPIGPKNDFGENGTCKYIYGFPADGKWQMCGHKHSNDRPYCDYHHSRVYDLISTAKSNRNYKKDLAPTPRKYVYPVRFKTI